MGAKHTPGPWFPTQDSRWNEVARIGRAWNIGTALALADMGHPEADARLIAAAPNLAFQLLAAANYIDTLGGDSRSYRQAYAEATGSAA